MTFKGFLKSVSSTKLVEKAEIIASASDGKLLWHKGIKTILNAASNNPPLAPTIKKDDANGILYGWLKKYKKSYDNRISVRSANLPSTIQDPIIETIIACRLKNLEKDALDKILFGHRLSMSAENVLGLLLEEYLSDELTPYRWHCCWGNTLRHVDFVNENGKLLQIKNRSNSENSSSSLVRRGTKIEKWYRVDAVTGEYHWEDLNQLCPRASFSEEKFKQFVIKTLKNNPQAMPIEPTNPWNLNS